MATHYYQIIRSVLTIGFVAACASIPTPTASPAIPVTPTARSATPTSPSPTVAPVSTETPDPMITPSTPVTAAAGTTDRDAEQVVGTVVRFSAGSTAVEVTIGEDNPTVRDFLAMLPFSLTLEEFASREKIAYLPRALAHAGSPGSDPEDGDLIYYIPWGNLGFYYNTAGIGYSDQTIHLGTYDASLEQLEQLEGQPVTVEVVR